MNIPPFFPLIPPLQTLMAGHLGCLVAFGWTKRASASLFADLALAATHFLSFPSHVELTCLFTLADIILSPFTLDRALTAA